MWAPWVHSPHGFSGWVPTPGILANQGPAHLPASTLLGCLPRQAEHQAARLWGPLTLLPSPAQPLLPPSPLGAHLELRCL